MQLHAYYYCLRPFSLASGDPQCGHCSVEISRVIPLKKQQGFVTMLGQMLPTLGSKVTPYLETVFSVLLKLGASCAQLLKQRALVSNHSNHCGVFGMAGEDKG